MVFWTWSRAVDGSSFSKLVTLTSGKIGTTDLQPLYRDLPIPKMKVYAGARWTSRIFEAALGPEMDHLRSKVLFLSLGGRICDDRQCGHLRGYEDGGKDACSLPVSGAVKSDITMLGGKKKTGICCPCHADLNHNRA